MWQEVTAVIAADYDVTLILTLGMIHIKLPTDTASEWLNVIRVESYFATTSFLLTALVAYIQSLRGFFDVATANVFFLMN